MASGRFARVTVLEARRTVPEGSWYWSLRLAKIRLPVQSRKDQSTKTKVQSTKYKDQKRLTLPLNLVLIYQPMQIRAADTQTFGRGNLIIVFKLQCVYHHSPS